MVSRRIAPDFITTGYASMNRKLMGTVTVVLFSMLAMLRPSDVAAQEYAPPYDGLQAGADAAARGEARRLAAIRLQLDSIELAKWYGGLPPGNEGVFFFQGGRFAAGLRVPGFAAWYPGFGPWQPYLVGGVPYAAIAPQSIGQRQVQTGPNRWESHPVYEGEFDGGAAGRRSKIIKTPGFFGSGSLGSSPVNSGPGPREF
jgi:hypothetical protein